MTSASPADKTAPAPKGQILVIDDDAGMRSLLSDVLTTAGYSVLGYSDAIGALKLIATEGQRINAIICDLNMPRMNGLEFLDILAKMNVKTPVILITAFATGPAVAAATQKGAFGYLSKPFQLAEMAELVGKAVA